MRSILFTLIILFTVVLASCRKDKNYPDIKTYDQQQIANYISANGITGMVKDPSGGDTTGTWYKMISVGTGKAVDYSDEISYVYTIRTLDGKFSATDTIINHYEGLEGHTAPKGLVLAIRNILKYKGGKMRVIIPSHLGYGVNGSGSGSSTLANARIEGNQSLDYTIELINSQGKYDDDVIQTYLTANGLTGYTRSPDSLWYKIIKPGTGASVDINSSVTINYTGQLLNHTFFDNGNVSTAATFNDLLGFTPGFFEGLKLVKVGGVISFIAPSKLEYSGGGRGAGSPTTVAVPADAPLRFEVTITAITN